MIDFILEYEPIRNMLKHEPFSKALNSEITDHEKFKNSFMDYVNDETYLKKLTLKKEKIVFDNCKSVKCFVCLDTKYLWNARNFFSSFDKKGNYEILNCYNCGDGEVSYFSPTNHILENKIRIFQYPVPQFKDILKELERKEEELALWSLFKGGKLCRTIREFTAIVDIEKLSSDISNLIQSHIGNLVSITTLVKSLEAKLTCSYDEETSNNEWCEQIDDSDGKIYIIFKLEKGFIQVSYDCGLLRLAGSTTEQSFHVKFTILKPKNKIAEKKCDEIINTTVNNHLMAII